MDEQARAALKEQQAVVVHPCEEAEESRDCPSLSGAAKCEAELHQEAYARGRIALADAAENVTLSKNSEIKEMALFLHRCIHSTREENRVCQACQAASLASWQPASLPVCQTASLPAGRPAAIL